MSTSLDVAVNGTNSPDFDNVRRAFALNFLENDELGAAVAIWVDGELVVNLWAGWADEARTRPWTEDTLAPVYSGTKGLMSTCVHMLVERGVLDLYAPVARYWPEFGQGGKESITLAMVLGHRSGVIGPRTRLTPEQAANWDEVCEHIARATPWWEPGTAQGYHMATFGFILGEVVRRTTGKTLGQFLRTEIAEPYGLDVHVGLPHSEHHRCAELINKPYLRDVFRGAPGEFDCMVITRWQVRSSRATSSPTTRSPARTSRCGAHWSSPAPTRTFPRWAWPPSTTPWPSASCSVTSTWMWCGCPKGIRSRCGAGSPGGQPRMGSGLHAQPALLRRAQPEDVRAWRVRWVLCLRRSGAPHRLLVCDEPIRRDQGGC